MHSEPPLGARISQTGDGDGIKPGFAGTNNKTVNNTFLGAADRSADARAAKEAAASFVAAKEAAASFVAAEEAAASFVAAKEAAASFVAAKRLQPPMKLPGGCSRLRKAAACFVVAKRLQLPMQLPRLSFS